MTDTPDPRRPPDHAPVAGALVHDFNNLLMVLQDYTASLLGRVEPDSSLHPDLVEMQAMLDRAGQLARELLNTVREQQGEPSRVDLNAVLGAVFPMLRCLLGTDIELTTELDPSLGDVVADRCQLERVLINLGLNARDAMPAGGSLLVRTRALQTREGRFARLVVRDSGDGMTEETRQRIFEPYFTTKRPNKGSGLGLSSVQAIILSVGGHINVTSQPGRGTTFTIDLPSRSANAAEPLAA